MSTTIKQFTSDLISSYSPSDSDFAESTVKKVVEFFSTRKNRTKDDDVNNSTGQQKVFTAVRKGIFEKLNKVKTGVDSVDAQPNRWEQTKSITAAALSELSKERQDEVVQLVEGNLLGLKKVRGISDKFNDVLKNRVEKKNASGIVEFSVIKSMKSAHEVILAGVGKVFSYFDLFAALLFITGRRQEELFQKMTFAPVDGKPYMLSVHGFAKSKATDSTPIEVPSLLNSKLVLRRIDELRALNSSPTVNIINKSINRAVERLFPEAMTAHKLRALYAESADVLFNNTIMNSVEIKSAEFKKKALHHNSRETTIDHYEYKSSDLQSDKEVSEYLSTTFKSMNSSVTKKFLPLKDIDLEVPSLPSGKPSKIAQEYIVNIKELMQLPIELTYANYKKRYGGVETTYKKIEELNSEIFDEHNQRVADASDDEDEDEDEDEDNSD